jgi:lipopolysaccharide export system protein LptC
MTANLETGEYEFEQVAVMFTPAERQDKALF